MGSDTGITRILQATRGIREEGQTLGTCKLMCARPSQHTRQGGRRAGGDTQWELTRGVQSSFRLGDASSSVKRGVWTSLVAPWIRIHLWVTGDTGSIPDL